MAAWAAQTRSRALRAPLQGEAPAQGLQRQRQEAVLGALAALERLTRQQLVALAPDQLGFVARWGRWLGGREGGWCLTADVATQQECVLPCNSRRWAGSAKSKQR